MSVIERTGAPVRKVRELHNHHIDSTIWNDFVFRDGDIVIASYGKSGTTWMQQIVGQLVFDGAPDVNVNELSPWLDLRIPDKATKLAALDAQTHRRFLKTHLPVDALVASPKAKYLYCARDGRDVVWSLHNHHINANADWFAAINDTPGRVGPPVPPADPDIRRYFHTWLAEDGAPFWSFWDNVRTWWGIRDQPNVRLVHYNALKRDLPGQLRRIARFLDIAVEESQWPTILEHCSFEWMKTHAPRVAPLGGVFWDGGAQTFIHKGTNGRWHDVLTEADNREYEQQAIAELGEACAHWVATGEDEPEPVTQA
ncbi:sulfotransferase domain-containing protein [Salinisphaera hydrothermalis]|uniref:sulfotransferase domain-containing protein n=1 Tax=Salinisphaera hydrothermalis TaxID=563188 RepID=UPI003340D279